MSNFIKIKEERININHILSYRPYIRKAGISEEDGKPYSAKHAIVVTFAILESTSHYFHDEFINNEFGAWTKDFLLDSEEELNSIIKKLDSLTLK